MKKLILTCSFAALAVTGTSLQAATQYFAGDGSLISAAKYSASPTGPTFTTAFTTGSVIGYGNTTNPGTGTGATITIGGFDITQNFNLTAGGTLSTGGTVVGINVADGKTLNLGGQSLSTAAGTGFIKNGNGTYFSSNGNAYGGGFTLNAGTVVVGGVNALGGATGNALTINGGILASNGTRDLTGKFGGGITVGGDFQLGALVAATPLASSTGNLTFSNTIALGAATRTITIGGNGTNTLGGVISGASGTGLTISALSGVTGNVTLTNANTFTGTFTANSGATVNLTANNTLGGASAVTIASGATVGTITNAGLTTMKSTSILTLDGSLDVSAGAETVASLAGTTANASLTIGKSTTNNGSFTVGGSTSTSYAGVIKDGAAGAGTTTFTRQGTGILTLTGASTYSGSTIVSGGSSLIVNNGTGSGTGTSTVAVSGNGTLLGGTGTISGATTIGASSKITGATSGTVGALTLNSGLSLTGTSGSLAAFVVDIDAATADRLTITGNLNLGTTFDQISFNQITAPTAASYTLLTYSGTLTGTFDTESFLPTGYSLQYNTGSISLVAVPEPSTWVGAGLLTGLAAWTRRKRFAGLLAA